MTWDCTENDPDVCAQRHLDLVLANKRIEEYKALLDSIPFRELLDLWMCSDPFPGGVNQAVIELWLNQEARRKGYENIVEAYHRHA